MTHQDDKMIDDVVENIAASLAQDLLRPETSVELVQACLREAGIDPEAVRREAERLVEDQLVGRRPRSTVDRSRPGFLRFRKMNHEQLVSQVNALRSNANVARSVDTRLRGSSAGDFGDDELIQMLEEMFGTDGGGSDEE